MKRLIDANAAIERLKLEGVMRYPQSWGMGLLAAMETIRGFPAVDAVEVIRCHQCKFSEPYERMGGRTGYYCLHPTHSLTYGQTWERVFNPVKEPDDFCSYGEAKSGTQPQREDI